MSRHEEMIARLNARVAELEAQAGDGTSSNKYRAELYDEVWQTARDMGYGNVIGALEELAALKAQPSAGSHDSVGDWRIDTSAGREILVYKECSVIEGEDAHYILGLISAEFRAQQPSAVHLLFDGPPGPGCGRFVEAEYPTGKSINAGEWSQRPDGYWQLVIQQPSGAVLPERQSRKEAFECGGVAQEQFVTGWNACLDEVARLNPCRAQSVPDVLFDGFAVYSALDAKAQRRTSPENVSDTLDAAVRLIRAAAPSAQQKESGDE